MCELREEEEEEGVMWVTSFIEKDLPQLGWIYVSFVSGGSQWSR